MKSPNHRHQVTIVKKACEKLRAYFTLPDVVGHLSNTHPDVDFGPGLALAMKELLSAGKLLCIGTTGAPAHEIYMSLSGTKHRIDRLPCRRWSGE